MDLRPSGHERILNLREGTGPVLDGTNVRLQSGATVHDEEAFDLVSGLVGDDWLLFASGDDLPLVLRDEVFANAQELLLS